MVNLTRLLHIAIKAAGQEPGNAALAISKSAISGVMLHESKITIGVIGRDEPFATLALGDAELASSEFEALIAELSA